ncbi:MAG: glucose-1-phosphate adenylyltransferase [Verrucomicrobiae bacterium]|nr:glucose-1-phosphate adenylyltransferase [Verrucomicrobiae bacterium]
MSQASSGIVQKIQRTAAIVMGGGAGTRLFPLTKDRAKPAVPLGGKYRLVDIPISNCLNSNLRQIYLLTQFNSSSLHRHIQRTYKFDEFSSGFVEIMAAQQTGNPNQGWYQGTADAVRHNLVHFDNEIYNTALILSGDQLYRMDYRSLLEEHATTGADITVAVIPVNREAVPEFGIMQIDEEHAIKRFVEKPKEETLLKDLHLDEGMRRVLNIQVNEPLYLASMGIYAFNRRVLHEVLNSDLLDFGKDIIPAAIGRYKVRAFVFQGYWEDVGTIRAYYRANLDLCEAKPQFEWNLPGQPIYTRARNLPPNRIENATLKNVSICAGCSIQEAILQRSLLGNRCVVQKGVKIEESIVMGADYYEGEKPISATIPLGIGEGTQIQKAIIDKNARIGRNCVISPHGKPSHSDHELYYIRDGIMVIPKNSVIPDHTVL